MVRRFAGAGASVVLALTLVLGSTPPASAQVSPAAPTPSSDQVLSHQVQQQQSGMNQQRQLAVLRAQAAAAVEACQAALREAQEADLLADLAARHLAAARQAADAARERLSAYVGSLYRTGMVSPAMPVYLSLLSGQHPRAVFSGLALAGRVGGNQGNVSLQLEEAKAAQSFAAERAAVTRDAAKAARRAASAAAVEAHRAVAAAVALTVTTS